ncbi:MAG TPA: DUF374 domain-containing protein [Candidatus Margulisiibacteriota bacterium]|nr:DUF374 domain-containing protein [Candidatus Margulisiibacteriota bacterium]
MESTTKKEPVANDPGEKRAASPPRVVHHSRQRGPLARFLRRNVRPLFSRRLSSFAAAVVPRLYMLYMQLVWATSRIEGRDFVRLKGIIAEHNGAVGLLWHEEVMTVAFGYYYLGFRPHTLASVGESGEVIARMLALCGFVVFRGGSTTGRSRRREGALEEMIAHMRTHDQVIYGLTVDGSKGPPYRMKTGGIIIARECGKPIVLARTWYKRCLRLPTWDRMAVPLPFNVIRYYLRGPYFVPDSACSTPGLEDFRLHLENDLIDLAAQSYDDMGQARPANLVKRSTCGERPGTHH